LAKLDSFPSQIESDNMTKPATRGPTAAQLNSQDRQTRRKIGRDVYAAFVAIGRAAGLEPGEIQTALALDRLLYDKPGQDCETPRKVPLSAIGAALTSKKETDEDKDAGWKKAQRDVSHLFCHAYPRVGLAMQTRHKGVKRGDFHMYASRWMIVADIVAEEFNAERGRILTSSIISREDKGPAIGAALERLALEALGFFDKLDALVIAPDHKPFAVVTQAQAEAFCKQNPKFKTASYAYSPPPEPDEARPFAVGDLERMTERDLSALEKRLDEIATRNTPEEARLYLANWLRRAKEKASSWTKVSDAGERHTHFETHDREERGTIHVYQNGYDAAEDHAADEGREPGQDGAASYPKNGYDAGVNPNRDSDLIFDDLQTADLDTRPNGGGAVTERRANLPPLPATLETESEPGAVVEVVPPSVALVGSVNFDDSLTATRWYISEGWPVLPVCNWNPAAGRCTTEWHKPTCQGRMPLVKGDGSGGYSAASLDAEQARQWWEVDFPDAGVGLRMDGKVNIDADRKSGGLESYEFLRDTFDLGATLRQITQGNGTHNIFRLAPQSRALLKSWNGALDKIQLPGIDLKVDTMGLTFGEPTIGPKGVYRWEDITAEIIDLPHTVAQFFHEIRHKDEQVKAATARGGGPRYASLPQQFDRDQSRYFRDVAPGQGQHARLLSVGNCVRHQYGLGADEIADVMRQHGAAFSIPFNDDAWIARTARSIERRR
jgi:hypothetical protein